MSLNPGARLGSHEIRSALGAGGMGEVYLARDTKLNRDVALKLLPSSVSQDPDRLARFRREAQVLATLNHPHIAQIYGLEDSTEQPALVMELVTGRTLAEIMVGGPMPWEDAIPIARQISEALEAAHERGIVHRDLKPANIKVRDDGVVKVLDFGLAKSLDAADSGINAATMTSPARLSPAGTEAGVILGTAAYMAPEQAKGRAVDKRADIWAFGVVLVEMLTGRPLFAGESMAETIAAVIKEDPKLDRLPAGTPARLRSLLARCLERDPTMRLRDIGEARILLSQPIDAAPAIPVVRPPRGRWVAAAIGAVALTAVTVSLILWLRPAPSAPLRRFELPGAVAEATDYAIAPDGSRLAYILDGSLFVRRFDELDAREITELPPATRQLVWSPDGLAIGFAAEGAVQSIPAEGGQRFVISKIPASGRLTSLVWLRSGKIVFSVWRDSLYEVPAAGGTPVIRLAIDEGTEIDFHHVSALPDDRLVISTHRRQEDSDIVELVDGQRRTVLTTDRSASWFEYLHPGTLLFRRSTTNPGIWAVPFDGGPIDVNTARLVQPGATDFRVSADGALVALIPAVSKASLVWVDRSGAETAVPGPMVESPDVDLEISPGGDRAAFVQGERAEVGGGVRSLPTANIFVRDLKVGVDTRLTITPPSSGMWADIGVPTWFPGGDRLVHRMGNVENFKLLERRADVAGDARVLAAGFLGRLLPDGRTLIYLHDERGRGLLRVAAIAADGTTEGKPLFQVDHQTNVRDFDVSSDGRLLAYVLVQPDGRGDIYLVDLRDLTAQRLVHEGGMRPRFSGDGRELFFTAGARDEQGQREGRLMRVAVTSASTVTVGPANQVLRDVPNGFLLSTYDVAPEGDRFLMWKPVPPAPGERQRLVFVQNALSAVPLR